MQPLLPLQQQQKSLFLRRVFGKVSKGYINLLNTKKREKSLPAIASSPYKSKSFTNVKEPAKTKATSFLQEAAPVGEELQTY
jgi:hypothetical protein